MKKVLEQISESKNAIAVLIDPEKFLKSDTTNFFKKLKTCSPDFLFVGGSTVSSSEFKSCVQQIKSNSSAPLVIFPGASHQIDETADAILFLSLISGRNPDYLIGHHVNAAEELEKMNLEIIPTAYLLIDGGKKSSVEYVSQTTPIPADQISIARKTALAGKLQGKLVTYIDCGSGALYPASIDMIRAVKSINLPLIVGGGIRSIDQIKQAHLSGANIVVIGNKIEEDIDFLLDIANYKSKKITSS